ncbi:hypothetical protein LINGRAHAP2_LOCUS24988 [Linum grandiflorum]
MVRRVLFQKTSWQSHCLKLAISRTLWL